ncbi:MAG: hypothetical protein ACUVTH_11480 [Thermogutta sp.]
MPCLCSGEDGHSIPFLGRLPRLCDWLSLSKLLLLSASQLDRGSLPGAITNEKWDGIFLIGADPAVPPLQYTLDFEVYYGIPLLGIMYLQPPQKAELATEFSIWTEEGVQLWLNRSSLQRILRESAQRPLVVDEWPTTDYRGRITVALARDSVFGCYFPETIEALERCGARIVDFSPLRDEQIPAETDVIYLGCGQLGIYASQLSENHCLKASIRNHVRKGGRVYAEGTGAAYLCQWMEIEPGQFIRGVGLLAAAARRLPRFGQPMPVTLTTTRRTWLVRSGTILRGYRNPEWWLQPESLSAPLIAEPGFEYDILGNERVFASVIHLDFSTQTELLDSFFDSKAAAQEFLKDVLSITHQKT